MRPSYSPKKNRTDVYGQEEQLEEKPLYVLNGKIIGSLFFLLQVLRPQVRRMRRGDPAAGLRQEGQGEGIPPQVLRMHGVSETGMV